MNQEIWRQVSPLFDHFDKQIDSFPTLESSDFFSCQPRVRSAIRRLVESKSYTRALIINSPDNTIYRKLIARELSQVSEQPVVLNESLAGRDVFPTINSSSQTEVIGLLDKADNGYLVLSPNWLMANPKLWPDLKAALLGDFIAPVDSDIKNPASNKITKSYNIKLVIVGDREQLANLEYLDEDFISGFTLFSEIELEMKLDEESIDSYLAYLKWFTNHHHFPQLTSDGIKALLNHGVRHTEDQGYVPLCLFWLSQILEDAMLSQKSAQLNASAIMAGVDNKYYRESYLPERAQTDILDGQVVIQTRDRQVGQVNGLTVIDIAGHPISYGEPARISCVIHFGDGDISDVERKAELGGNLHAKGMMIMQAFVSSALNLDEPLPYSASIVFEQSYSEVDGDSASLAEVVSFVSALSDIEVNQEIAVTGAVDQFGRVQAVGGLNEKIEGFYQVCKHQGLTGSQGVVLPKSNLRNLALHHNVVESIKAGEFHIYPVETVDDAIPLLLDKPFRGDDSVLEQISAKIDELDHQPSPTLWQRMKRVFIHN